MSGKHNAWGIFQVASKALVAGVLNSPNAIKSMTEPLVLHSDIVASAQ